MASMSIAECIAVLYAFAATGLVLEYADCTHIERDQTPAHIGRRSKRDTVSDLLKVIGSTDENNQSFEEINLEDARYDATCKLIFQFGFKTPDEMLWTQYSSCTCSFYGPQHAVAAAHCFKDGIQKAEGNIYTRVAVVPRFGRKKGEKADVDDDNKKREIEVAEWWYPEAYNVPLDKNGNPKPKDPASQHDVAFFKTAKPNDDNRHYSLAKPTDLEAYYGKAAETVGYPGGYKQGSTAVRITGTLLDLKDSGDLSKQIVIQDAKKKSCMTEGSSGGPWFISDVVLKEQVTAKTITEAQRSERQRWIIGVNSWISSGHTVTFSPLISNNYIDASSKFQQGQGANIPGGVYRAPNSGNEEKNLGVLKKPTIVKVTTTKLEEKKPMIESVKVTTTKLEKKLLPTPIIKKVVS